MAEAEVSIGDRVRVLRKHSLWVVEEVYLPQSGNSDVLLRLRDTAAGRDRTALVPATSVLRANQSPASAPTSPAVTRSTSAASALLPESAIADLRAAVDIWDIRSTVHHLRLGGWKLNDIGQALGVSRERVRQHAAAYDRASDRRPERTYAPSPDAIRATEKAAAEASARPSRRRVNGLKQQDPALLLPVELLNRISSLGELVSTVNGGSPLDHPGRTAGADYKAALLEAIDGYGVSATRLSLVLGQSVGTVRSWLARHGHGALAPSAKPYLGKKSQGPVAARRVRLMAGGTCRRGHLLSEENIRSNGKAGNICGTCADARYYEKYGRYPRNRGTRSAGSPDREKQ